MEDHRKKESATKNGRQKDILKKSEALEMLKAIQEVGQMNQLISNHYLWAIEFIEARNLKIEFGNFLAAKKRIN